MLFVLLLGSFRLFLGACNDFRMWILLLWLLYLSLLYHSFPFFFLFLTGSAPGHIVLPDHIPCVKPAHDITAHKWQLLNLHLHSDLLYISSGLPGWLPPEKPTMFFRSPHWTWPLLPKPPPFLHVSDSGKHHPVKQPGNPSWIFSKEPGWGVGSKERYKWLTMSDVLCLAFVF